MRLTMLGAVCALGLLAACRASPPARTPSPVAPTAPPTAAQESLPAFPPDVNPLSGEHVADTSLLKIPALLVSISHFPATARPQAGLSFAPFVYEFYITEGATRFLAVFHGEWPHPEIPVRGGCEPRGGPFVQSAVLIGNRVWLDTNGNGLQDPGEEGISGACLDLFDSAGNLLQRTSSDTNGFYGFNVQPGEYRVQVEMPDGLSLTAQHAGVPEADSDADPVSRQFAAHISADDLTYDVGLVPANGAPMPDANTMPAALVGPVRSGRLIYGYIAGFFKNSCLIYAFASEEVLARLPQCHMVFHQLSAGGYMMGLDEMASVAQETLKANGSDFDYASNLYSSDPPGGGMPASILKVYYSYQNQSGWAYDPLSQSYLRYVDTSEYDEAGVLHPDTDRLTGRQLSVQDVVVLSASHDVVSPTNLDIHLDEGKQGKAVLFRNARMFKITWSTKPWPDGEPRPIQFLGEDGKPVPLAPGHTWVIVVTPDSRLTETAPGRWLLSFKPPPGAK
ncbi:MAG: SdrD B-like domain-containing protein [Anaerolineae bacterium]